MKGLDKSNIALEAEFRDIQKAAEATTAEAENIVKLVPFHLSIPVTSLKETRKFYRDILGVEERRASATSAHFDFFGSQLTCHEVPEYQAWELWREVDAEDVPVPHFGAALSFEQFSKVRDSLLNHAVKLILQPHARFIGKGHEQHVLFVADPSGHGIEIKSFTKVAVGEWA
ncbi:VOC family protein [Oscillatoria sp. CS-180]|uniref:VOC family protein n=1 Tax=Oscillatoria sp. CS-180 TaxID=3021720 RepID=UPI00232C935C|nr:VOC family protein [Oscillatoria sp. CS-180]MDB9525289.1 VOC family protein [Oscillatoria sp. CS-180]